MSVESILDFQLICHLQYVYIPGTFFTLIVSDESIEDQELIRRVFLLHASFGKTSAMLACQWRLIRYGRTSGVILLS